MKLYYAPRTRATRVRWLLEELGVPYDLVRMNLQAKDQKKPEYLKVNPNGAVPALEDGNLTLFESGAIVAYLADKYPDRKFAPPTSSPDRGTYYKWMFYYAATLEPAGVQYILHHQWLPEADRVPRLAEEGKARTRELLKIVQDALNGREYLVGDCFTAADIIYTSGLNFLGMFGLLEGFPELQEYVNRHKARPAFERATKD